ncbi:MAG: transpeptidase family protein [Bacteroidetes bacterium]|nr:transpeptidase family protein [Bacteroidota bacterium]
MNVKSNILLRVYLVAGLCLLFGVIVLGKIYEIQTYKNGYWKSLADSLTTNYFDVKAERGNIYSADDKLLATSIPYFDLHVDLASSAMTQEIFRNNVDSLAYYMSKYIGKLSANEYRQRLVNARNKKNRYYPIFKDANYNQLKFIKQWPLFREGKFKGGLIVESHQERKNPYGYLAQRTIGLVRENAQDIGLEEAVDSLLDGVEGKVLKQKIAGGEWIPIKGANQIEPKNGFDIITTINLGLQDITESTLLQAVTEYKADFGCAVLMEVQTGAIKAIANLGKNKNETYSENFNYAIGLSNEPGSVFKTAGYLALFDDGYITLNDSINTNHATAFFAGVKLTDDGHNSQYTFLTPGKALAISSNVAIANWLVKYYGNNKQAYYNKLKQFGLTEPTNITLKGERKPLIHKPEQWSAISIPWMAHGYEVKLTPLQILTFYNAIANNGTRVRPYLVDRVEDNGKIIRQYAFEKNSQKICSENAAQMAKAILLRVTEDKNGTGRKIRSPYYRIAGKTGTAKMSFGNTGYTDKNLSTFVGFFPANHPMYSCIVVLGGPQGLFTSGGVVSAPVFRTMADKIITSNIASNTAVNKDSLLTNQPIPPVLGTSTYVEELMKRLKIRFNFGENWNYALLRADEQNKNWITKISYPSNNTIPNVKGLLLDDAVSILENKGLKVVFSGKGKVSQQSLNAGSPIIKGNEIYLTLN